MHGGRRSNNKMADLLSAFEQQTYSSSSRRAGGAVSEPSSLNPFEVQNPANASLEPVSSHLQLVLADDNNGGCFYVFCRDLLSANSRSTLYCADKTSAGYGK